MLLKKWNLILGSYGGYGGPGGLYPGAGTAGQKPPKPGKTRSMDMSIGINKGEILCYLW